MSLMIRGLRDRYAAACADIRSEAAGGSRAGYLVDRKQDFFAMPLKSLAP
jgi:hypothetical protein